MRDACGDITGSSLPYRTQEVATPAVLSDMLNSGALQPTATPVQLRRVERQPIPSVSSNCENLVLTIEQAGEQTLPRSLFVKLPMESC
ncbi:MAG: hypothetical protein IPG64_11125 [Haliea sp.]|nr:hypothetical protein [Haliea sp.]